MVVSVWFGGIDGSVIEARAETEPHYTASVMKVPVAIAAHRRADRGLLDLDASVPVHADFPSEVAGARFTMDEAEDQDPETWAALGRTLPLRELLGRSITHSGNLAANLVLERAGLDEVAAVLAAAGCTPATAIVRGIEDAPARDAGRQNMITAYDAARIFAGIANRTVASATACAELETVLAAQTWRDAIPKGLAGHEVTVANKTGWIDGVRHDVALLRTPDRAPLVMAILTTGLDDDTAEEQIAELAGQLWTTL